jgi:hypothetical protein
MDEEVMRVLAPLFEPFPVHFEVERCHSVERRGLGMNLNKVVRESSWRITPFEEIQHATTPHR